MRKNLTFLVCSILTGAMAMFLSPEANAQKNGAGSGQTRIGVSIDDWDLGDGQPTTNFTTAERYGIKIGLRPVERFGSFDLPLKKKGQIGIYTVPTGTLGGHSAWGFSIYVNVENAFGAAEGTTLEDYDIVVTQDYDVAGNWFGFTELDSTNYFDLEAKTVVDSLPGFPGFGNVDLPFKYQQSWAPTFGTTGFDTGAEAAYTITLSLIPKTFKGPPLSVTVVANAIDFD